MAVDISRSAIPETTAQIRDGGFQQETRINVPLLNEHHLMPEFVFRESYCAHFLLPVSPLPFRFFLYTLMQALLPY
ncbi:hypothetical protein VRU00_004678 [Escherichia coli]|nr:hypothetical protein [Escherichia coli]